jgi:hypothetical protein
MILARQSIEQEDPEKRQEVGSEEEHRIKHAEVIQV